MSVRIPPINYNKLNTVQNQTPGIYPPPFEGSVTAAPFVNMLNNLFGTQGPLGKYKLVAITPGEPGQQPFWTIDVRQGWRTEVKELCEGTIQKAIDDNLHLNGWTFQVVDGSNLELPQQRPAQMNSTPKS